MIAKSIVRYVTYGVGRVLRETGLGTHTKKL